MSANITAIRAKKLLLDNELIVCKANIHSIIFAPTAICFALAMWTYIEQSFEIFTIIFVWAFIAAGVYFLLPKLIYYCFSEIVVTNSRIIESSGMLFTDARAAYHVDQDNVIISRTPLGRIFNYGTIEIVCPGNNGMVFTHIADPYQFAKTIDVQKNKIRGN